MKYSSAVLLLSLFLIPVGRSLAQQSPDPKQTELIAYAHFKGLTPAEQNQLLSQAQSGDAEAQYWMGVLYTEGVAPKNLEKGRRWLLKSAEQGYAPAQRAYGLMSAHVNPPVGERWMMRAAEQGDAEAQFWLGIGYEQNWFGTADVKEAVKWYQKAAQGGNPDAQVELGHKYENGEGVEQSFRLAAEWYRRAAEYVPDWVAQAKERINWASFIWKGAELPRTMCRHISGLV